MDRMIRIPVLELFTELTSRFNFDGGRKRIHVHVIPRHPNCYLSLTGPQCNLKTVRLKVLVGQKLQNCDSAACTHSETVRNYCGKPVSYLTSPLAGGMHMRGGFQRREGIIRHISSESFCETPFLHVRAGVLSGVLQSGHKATLRHVRSQCNYDHRSLLTPDRLNGDHCCGTATRATAQKPPQAHRRATFQ